MGLMSIKNKYINNSIKINNMTYDLFSKHRSKIMAVSIIMIIIFHYFEDVTLYLNGNIFSKVWMRLVGSFGVEIFLFLSGMGLYFSYTKNRNIKLFYKKDISKHYCLFLYGQFRYTLL